RSAFSRMITRQLDTVGRRAASSTTVRIRSMPMDSSWGWMNTTSPWESARVARQCSHRPQPTSSGSEHTRAAAKARAATERPEPGGPVKSQECVKVESLAVPASPAPAPAPPSRAIWRAVVAASISVCTTAGGLARLSKTRELLTTSTLIGWHCRSHVRRHDRVLGMSRLLQALKWLWGTSWPLYAATVLGTNVLGALAIMLFVRYLIPHPTEASFDSDISYLPVVGGVYLVFAVLVGILVTFLMFRPVLDWQRHPEEHDPNMVRNLVMRIPIYQAILCAVVWFIGIIIATAITATMSTPLAVIVFVSTMLACAV